MIFLTYNDNYNGIYKSQVIDVCKFLQKELLVKVKLLLEREGVGDSDNKEGREDKEGRSLFSFFA